MRVRDGVREVKVPHAICLFAFTYRAFHFPHSIVDIFHDCSSRIHQIGEHSCQDHLEASDQQHGSQDQRLNVRVALGRHEQEVVQEPQSE